MREKFLLFRVLRFADKQAFGELYLEFSPRIHRYLTFKLPTPADVEDVLSEVFLSVWSYITTTPVDSLSGLLFAMARNHVANYYRSKGRVELPADMEEFQERILFTDDGAHLRQIEAGTDLELVREAVLRLPPVEQAVLLLRYFDGLSVDEVAEQLQKTENHVRVISHRALKSLRAYLESHGQPTA
ncbi:MAG: RNA polymerase sigma factor [Parcubacteria group bacterium GW2011_GWA2_56_7]|nr:MAG: RNA polymerase sigma factor [Parcubacteria group bacterium GW2011_GWA2_56_7]